MEIKISAIPNSGLEIKGKLSLESLNSRIEQGDSAGIVFLSEPSVDLKVTREIQGANIKGTISSTYRQPCSRCDEPLEEPLLVNIDWTLKPKVAGQDFDDLGVVTYEGDRLDLRDPLEEAIILHLSPYLLPKLEDEKCTRCGKDCPKVVWGKSEGNQLGDLLETILEGNIRSDN